MPLTINYLTGDGILDDRIQCAIELPDSGTSVSVSGSVKKVGGTAQAITGSPLTAPADPAGGHTTTWIIQVDKGNGAATVKSLVDGTPTPDTGSDASAMEVISTQTIQPTTSDLALVVATTPDTY